MTLANPAVPDVEVAQLRVVVVDELVALSRVALSRERSVELRLELVDRLHGGLRPGVPFHRAAGPRGKQRSPAPIDGPRRRVLGDVELFPQDVLIRRLVDMDGHDVEPLQALIDTRLL